MFWKATTIFLGRTGVCEPPAWVFLCPPCCLLWMFLLLDCSGVSWGLSSAGLGKEFSSVSVAALVNCVPQERNLQYKSVRGRGFCKHSISIMDFSNEQNKGNHFFYLLHNKLQTSLTLVYKLWFSSHGCIQPKFGLDAIRVFTQS